MLRHRLPGLTPDELLSARGIPFVMANELKEIEIAGTRAIETLDSGYTIMALKSLNNGRTSQNVSLNITLLTYLIVKPRLSLIQYVSSCILLLTYWLYLCSIPLAL
jgi:hypothetical protein